jgi:alpha-D-ribose 1-methylphosphonate 5-triphosphate synthase subunit PhnG
LIEKIPYLSDEEVVNLLANAQRLSTQGDEKQQSQAAELIEPLEQAAAERRAARLAATQAKRAARRPRKNAA